MLYILATFLLTAGVVMAQSANTSAPGPTIQREPGMNSNNLPNPGNPQTDLSHRDTDVTATTTATATTGTAATGTTTTTTTTTGTETETTKGMDMDMDMHTDAHAKGAVDVDVKHPATDTHMNTRALPNTASELPLLGIAGLLALGSALMVRMTRRNG
jgi:cytoskeletal protein RodZ